MKIYRKSKIFWQVQFYTNFPLKKFEKFNAFHSTFGSVWDGNHDESKLAQSALFNRLI